MKRKQKGKIRLANVECNLKIKSNIQNLYNLEAEEKLEKVKQLFPSNIVYSRIKYNSNIYALGDCVVLKNGNEENAIGKIIKIISYGGNEKHPYWPTILVQM